MINKSRLINSMKTLEVELRKAGKIDTADFFKKSIVTINSELDPEVLKQLLEQICASGAISQYANFSYREDELFDECFEEAKHLISVI